MSKLYFNKHGLYIGSTEFGDFDSPDESANQHRFKLVEGEVVDGWPGVADNDIMPLFNAEMEQNSFSDLKEETVSKIKMITRGKIEALAWKIERATEQDAINGTNTILDVYAEREALRVAGNAAEASILAATTIEEAEEAFNLFRG